MKYYLINNEKLLKTNKCIRSLKEAEKLINNEIKVKSVEFISMYKYYKTLLKQKRRSSMTEI